MNQNFGYFVYQMRGSGICRFGGDREQPDLAVVSLMEKATRPYL